MEAPTAAPAVQVQQTPATTEGVHDDAFAALESMASEDGSKPSPKPTPKPEAAKPAPAKAAAKPDAPKVERPAATTEKPKGDEAAKPPAKTDDKAPEAKADTEPKTNAALREAYSRSKSDVANLRREIETLKSAAPKEFKIEEAPQFKSLREKHEALVKRAEELENTVRYTNYEASEEFKTKYQEPYEKAAKLSTLSAQQLKIATVDEATGAETSRNMTAEEFWSIVQAPDDESALSAAEKLFGKGSTRAARVADLRDKVVQAHNAAAQAKEDFKKNASERARTMQEQQEAFTKSQQEAFTKHRDEALNNPKYADWFKAEEGDAKAAELLENGMKWVDAALSGDLPPEKASKNLAAIRNKAGAFDHVVHKLNSAKSLVKELQAKLAEYEASKPGDGELPKGGAAEDDDSMEAAFKALESRAERA